MSRTLSANLVTHLAARSHTRCSMLLLDLNDGTSIGITDHNDDIDYDIGDGIVTYQAETGILPSDVALSATLDADNYEVRGPITDDVVTLAGLLGGRYNRARARLFQINWKHPADGAIKIMAGNVSQARPEGGEFVFEIRSDFDRFNQVVGRLITNNCDADFADGVRCHATPITTTGTVIAVSSALVFAVSFTGGPYADDFFNFGTVIGLTGANAGTTVEIQDWSDAGAIELFVPLGVVPEIGDTFTVKDGCLKSRTACMAHDNIEEFRGFPEVPGSDQVLRATIPGQGGD